MPRVSQEWNIQQDDKVAVVKLQNDVNAKAPLYEAAKRQGATLAKLQKARFTTENHDNGTVALVLAWND